PTIYELNAHGEQRSAREIPRLVAAGVGITWRAGRRELITIAALEVLCGAGVAALLDRRSSQPANQPRPGEGGQGVRPGGVPAGPARPALRRADRRDAPGLVPADEHHG